MDKKVIPISKLSGTIEVPGDKSITHRALILASMCKGEVPISNISSALDCLSTITCLKQMGVDIQRKSTSEVVVKGCGVSGFNEPSSVLNAQNSGTTLRLMSGLLCGQPFYSVITGDKSLQKRPMNRIIKPMTRMGAVIFSRDNNSRPPITIIGRGLHPISYNMPIASAQVKSAILIAGLHCKGETTVVEKIKSRDHTERMMKHLGCEIKYNNNEISIRGNKIVPREITVPGDISSAVYFITAGLLVKGSHIIIKNVGINETRMGFVRTLLKMGADIKTNETITKNEEPFGDIEIRPSELNSINVGAKDIPSMIDEIPLLALTASQANGKTIITGAKELRYKESDRLSSIVIELKRLGANIIEHEDGLEIEGPTQLTGTEVKSYGDHRMAMTMAVAGLIAKNETLIKDTDSAAVSFPEFFNILESLYK